MRGGGREGGGGVHLRSELGGAGGGRGLQPTHRCVCPKKSRRTDSGHAAAGPSRAALSLPSVGTTTLVISRSMLSTPPPLTNPICTTRLMFAMHSGCSAGSSTPPPPPPPPLGRAAGSRFTKY
jgi:hypothetical protein